MVQSLIKVSQKHQHVIVKGAGGLQGKTGAKGDKGDTGATGPKGDAATIAVGQVSTLPAGSSATVTNIGTDTDARFSFGIPQGAKGDKGDKGDAGAGLQITGTVATYADLPTNLGPSDAGKAYFVQADGKLYVWTGTSFPADGEGTQFKGDTGATGPQGPVGPAGFSPIATVTKQGDTATISITDSTGTTTASVSDGTNITVDSALSTVSENPVQNKVITASLNGKAEATDTAFIGTVLSTPTDVDYVSSVNIQNGAVTTAKIADGAVTSQNIDFTKYIYATGSSFQVGVAGDGSAVYKTTVSATVPAGTTTYFVNIPVESLPLSARILSVDMACTTGSDAFPSFYLSTTNYRVGFLRKGGTSWSLQCRLPSGQTDSSTYRAIVTFIK